MKLLRTVIYIHQKQIVKTIENAMPGIVHAFLSKSKGKGGLVEKKKDDAAIWFEIFTSVADEYKRPVR